MKDAVNFTKKYLDALVPGESGRRYYVYDTRVRGLALGVYPSGGKRFILYRWIKGRPERLPIGRYPDLSLEQARGKASELNAAIARGENPADKARTLRAESTLAEAFKLFTEHKKTKRKTWADDERQLDRYLDWKTSSRWRLRKLSDISRSEIERLHLRIGEENGHYAANRTLMLLRAVFNYAAKHGWQGQNPASGITRFPEPSRERFLGPEEMPRFFRALRAKETHPDFRDFFMLLLLTGVRRGNLLCARWEEINFAAEVWNIPDTKPGRPHSVALVPEALKTLKRRRAAINGSIEFVFPSTRLGRQAISGHLEDPKGAWADLLKRAGIKNLRMHDLRRTHGSWQAATGASLPVIGRSLGHTQASTTMIYSRLNLDPVREAVNRATTAMMAAARRKPKSETQKAEIVEISAVRNARTARAGD